MIIFDLDGTLADCEHRRHFVDKSYITCGKNCTPKKRCIECLRKLEKDQPNWKAFYEACDQDKVIWPVKSILVQNSHRDIEIWSGRCESVRKKTILWIFDHTELNEAFIDSILKMRPIGDYTPDDQLKEKWLDEALDQGKKINFVFTSDPKEIEMWRRRGIFVFDCNQTQKEF